MRKVLFVLILVIATVPLHAQWRRGGLFGADVRALIVDPDHPDTYYLGTSGGEVYISDDGAKTWRNAFGGTPFPGYVVDNLVIDRDTTTGALVERGAFNTTKNRLAINPDGTFIAASETSSNEVSEFHVDPNTGDIAATDIRISVWAVE